MLTFEMIRELERQERANKKLQRLPGNLVEELRDYIKRKEKTAEKTSADIRELENVKNTVRRFLELREDKIAAMALSAARTGLPPSNLTKEEEKAFYSIADALKSHREYFFAELGKSQAEEKKEEHTEQHKEQRVLYRVKKEIQEFVGPDMKTYRLVRGEVVSLPKALNDLLLKEGVIEEIRE